MDTWVQNENLTRGSMEERETKEVKRERERENSVIKTGGAEA